METVQRPAHAAIGQDLQEGAADRQYEDDDGYPAGVRDVSVHLGDGWAAVSSPRAEFTADRVAATFGLGKAYNVFVYAYDVH